jgi:hypothetical protein
VPSMRSRHKCIRRSGVPNVMDEHTEPHDQDAEPPTADGNEPDTDQLDPDSEPASDPDPDPDAGSTQTRHEKDA